MSKQIGFVLALGVLVANVATAADCEKDEYIVGIDSSRADNTNGWAIWVSEKPYFDKTATRYPSDLGSAITGGGRIDLNKDRGRFVLSMAMNAMNMGYKVTISDIYGAQFCDDFQDIEISNKY